MVYSRRLVFLTTSVVGCYNTATAFNVQQQSTQSAQLKHHHIIRRRHAYNNKGRTISSASSVLLHATPQLKEETENKSIEKGSNDVEDNIPFMMVDSSAEEQKIKLDELDDRISLSNIEKPLFLGKPVMTMPSVPVDNSSGLFWRGVVVALCAFWASNFAAAKLVMAEPGVDSSLYALSRFGVAFLALAPGAIKAIVKDDAIDFKTAKAAAVCGGWVAFGYLGQTIGLLTTTASRACVICTLHCVFVAIVAEVMRVSRINSSTTTESETDDKSTSFDLMRLVPAAVAVTGVAIVELKGAGGAPTIGDAISFAQPIGFGLGYLQLEELMRERPDAALPVSAIKLAVVALCSLGLFEFSPLMNGSGVGLEDFALRLPDFTPILSSSTALGGILYTGIVTTALALWVESMAFKRVPATDASIILTTEPLFAAVAGALTLGETFGISDYIGATLIVGACILAVLLDDAATDDQCQVDDAEQGICEPPRTIPISAD